MPDRQAAAQERWAAGAAIGIQIAEHQSFRPKINEGIIFQDVVCCALGRDAGPHLDCAAGAGTFHSRR